VLQTHGADAEVRQQVEALLGSAGDTLDDRAILDELSGIQVSGDSFLEIFATNKQFRRRYPRVSDL
jgi:hypothetical protein